MNSTSLLASSIQLLAVLAIEVALIGLVVTVWARRVRSAIWRRLLWQVGLVAVLAITVAELSGSGRSLAGWSLDRLSWHRPNSVSPKPPAAAVPQLNPEFRSQVTARLTARRFAQSETAGSRADPRRPIEMAPNEAEVPTESALRSTFFAPPAAEFGSDSLYVTWLWLAWATGTTVLAVRAWLGRCLLSVFCFRRRQITDPVLLDRVHALSRALGIRQRVRLIESARLRTPIAFGLVRPTIGLPSDFSIRITPPRQEAMLAHELAHLAAGDPFWLLLADSCAALLWWHPVAWWARREFRLASEFAADEASLVLKDGPTLLAECLVEIGARLAVQRELGQLHVSGFRSHLAQRVQRLVHLKAGTWSRAPKLRGALLLTLGPLAMAVLVVLCTAWATPRALTKGNSMQSMQLSLKRSFATLALLATFAGPEPSTAAGTEPAKPAGSGAPAPAGITLAPDGAAPAAIPAGNAPNDAALAAFRRRYGLEPMTAVAPSPAGNPKRQKIQTKLNELILREIQFDGLPLSEVIRELSDQAAKLDPEKKGINFLINANNAPTAAPASIDPTTGLPLAAAPVESIDVNAVVVKFSLPLRNVSLNDTLEAVVRVAEQPLEYSVEDYGVVISAKPQVTIGQPLSGSPSPGPEPLWAATFKVDTNTFLAGLENAFGITIPKAEAGQPKARAREIQFALKALLSQLGVTGGDSKTVFYNDVTGMIMVRATAGEQGVIQAAIETLGGTPMASYGGGGGGLGGFGIAGPGGR